jgi:hypothetical protein
MTMNDCRSAISGRRGYFIDSRELPPDRVTHDGGAEHGAETAGLPTRFVGLEAADKPVVSSNQFTLL